MNNQLRLYRLLIYRNLDWAIRQSRFRLHIRNDLLLLCTSIRYSQQRTDHVSLIAQSQHEPIFGIVPLRAVNPVNSTGVFIEAAPWFHFISAVLRGCSPDTTVVPEGRCDSMLRTFPAAPIVPPE
jgi:hypothetical protein